MASRSPRGGTVLASGIRTRERKERKLYSDDWALGDEEIEGFHTFDLHEKINSPKFDLNFIKDLTDKEFNLGYIQRNGFNWPLLFRKTDQLGIVIPSEKFTINDVRLCVGSRRMLDVMDVNTQKNVEMTMKDWQRYYESQDKDKLLNVISLEFSHTKLENLVEAPTVVRQIDWVEKVWPRHLKEAQTESTNVLEDMMYPKVQKYCLMSVSGCYTDFHIDFGGTSVWYHILKGRKIFWLIPPSEKNLQLYEQWVLSGKQSDVFFGDNVDKCARVELNAGYTFFIPTGWIHAVYTPDDSLVFGGNFLHSFGIEKQLRVATVEDTTHVPQKFRYPFFTEMLWYLLERYVHVLLGQSHLSLPPDEQEKYDKYEATVNKVEKKHVHLTQYELHGMKAVVMFLHSLPTSKKFVPELIKDPIALIRDVRRVVEEHRYDDPELAVTCLPVIDWWTRAPVKFTVKRSYCDSAVYLKKARIGGDEGRCGAVKLPPNVSKVRHRRIRCKECEPCIRNDCRQCTYCLDMMKYGGSGTMKQTCKLKKCVQPVLPVTALCYLCQLDGWMQSFSGVPHKAPPSAGPSAVMECILCFKVSHPTCIEVQFKGVECIVNEDLPNSWECAECVQLGYNKEYKHNRVSSSRVSSAGSDTNIKSPSVLSESEENKCTGAVNQEEPVSRDVSGQDSKLLSAKASGVSCIDPSALTAEKCESNPNQLPTWEQLQSRVSKPLVKPTWIIRPPPPSLLNEENDAESDGGDTQSSKKLPPPPQMLKEVMVPVFSKLPVKDLLSVMRVCRTWASWSIDSSLWSSVSFAHSQIKEFQLEGTVRRQPSKLILDWSNISYDQFLWLICRLPQLQILHCEGISWGVTRCLVSPYCPVLTELNLSNGEGVDDEALATLLRAPPFNRPGFRDTSSRLRHLTTFRLSGTGVGDISIALIARTLPFLTDLDLSSCVKLTNLAPELLSHSTSLVCHSLRKLDLRGCHGLTPFTLPALANLPLLSYLALDPCELIPFKAIKVWGMTHDYSFHDKGIMTRKVKENIISEDDMEKDNTNMNSTVSKNKLKKETTSSKRNDLIDNAGKPNNSIKTNRNKEKSLIKYSLPKNPNKNLKTSKPRIKQKGSSAGGTDSTLSKRSTITSQDLNKKSEERSENSSSDSCRRSNRSNKGKKYKLALSKSSVRNKITETISANEGKLEKNSNISSELIHSVKYKNIPRLTVKKSGPHESSEVDKKVIFTRSKKSDVKIKKPKKKIVKRHHKPSRGPVVVLKGAENCDKPKDIKVHISLKQVNRSLINRRSKSQDESTSEMGSNEIKTLKREENLALKKIKRMPSNEDRVSPSSIANIKRKERNGSSSSTSSTSSQVSLSKKMKIEIQSLTKLSRRKIDIVRTTPASNPTEKTKSVYEAVTADNLVSTERASGKERPERLHRSPRRLSST